MSIEENKVLVRHLFNEVWNKANLNIVDELCATNFTFNYAPSGISNDLEGYKQTGIIWTSGISDMKVTLEDMVAEGDKVAVRYKVGCKHTGEFMGVPPTGKQLAMVGFSIFCIKDGKIVEEWGEMDMMGLMQQIGDNPQE